MTWYCYILGNNKEIDQNRTYNGMTNNPKKRIRQHNSELVGGARYTKKYGDTSWRYIAVVKGLPDKINCLQMEWRIKHPDNKRRRSRKYLGPVGRIKGLLEVLCLEKWTSKSDIMNEDMNLEVYILNEFTDTVEDFKNKIPDNIHIHYVEIIDNDHFD